MVDILRRLTPEMVQTMGNFLIATPPSVQEQFSAQKTQWQAAVQNHDQWLVDRDLCLKTLDEGVEKARGVFERESGVVAKARGPVSLRELYGHPDYHGFKKIFGKRVDPPHVSLSDGEAQFEQAKSVAEKGKVIVTTVFEPRVASAQEKVARAQQDMVKLIEGVVLADETHVLARSYVHSFPDRQGRIVDAIAQSQVSDEDWLDGFREFFLERNKINPRIITNAAQKYGQWVFAGLPTREEFSRLPKEDQNLWKSYKKRELRQQLGLE